MIPPRQNPDQAVAEPLAQSPVLRSDRDWSARARTNALDTQRHSRFVRFMKRILPLAAVALLAAVVVYALQPRQQSRSRVAMTFQRLGIVNNDLTMIKPHLDGSDNSGNPYVVTADQAIQFLRSGKMARLKNVEGDETFKDGTWVDTRATSGLLDAKKRTLSLAGIVSVYSNSGYEIHTTAAHVDMARGIIEGKVPATGQGPLGNFRADQFKTDHKARQIFLYGNVHMIIDGHGAKGA